MTPDEFSSVENYLSIKAASKFRLYGTVQIIWIVHNRR